MPVSWRNILRFTLTPPTFYSNVNVVDMSRYSSVDVGRPVTISVTSPLLHYTTEKEARRFGTS